MIRSRLMLPALVWSTLATVVHAAGLPACPVQSGETVNYDILRGGNVIGHQTVHYTLAGPDLTVEIKVSASLSLLGVRVYHYDHHGIERWHGGQMVGLETKTDDNGTPRQVNAVRDPASGWRGTTGAAAGPAPLLDSSLWNAETVTATRLIDRETGAVVPIRVSPAGDELLQLGGRQVSAHKYDMVGDVSGNAWYDGAGCWVRAVFHTRVDGSLVEVRAR